MSTPPTGRLICVDGTELYVVERGSAAALPLLILHGGPGLDHTMFGNYLDPLATAYRLVFIDGREQGRSLRGTDPAGWTLSRHARDVSGVAAALGAERYAVLGHSFGAFVALQHAVELPGAAAATVVSSGVPATSFLEAVASGLAVFEPEELRARVSASWAAEATVRTQADCRRVLTDQAPWHFADPRDPRIETWLAAMEGMVYSPDVLRATSLEGDGLVIEVEDALPTVPQPMLVLAGRDDRTCIPAAAERIAELAPHAELHVFERSGHMTFVEQPAEYVEVVRGFLDRVT